MPLIFFCRMHKSEFRGAYWKMTGGMHMKRIKRILVALCCVCLLAAGG